MYAKIINLVNVSKNNKFVEFEIFYLFEANLFLSLVYIKFTSSQLLLKQTSQLPLILILEIDPVVQ